MSHIHLPDGILPIWLWVSGYVLAFVVGMIFLRIARKEGARRRLPLLGMMSAVMVLGASVEIVPIAYHVNLTAVSGILLGPSLVFIATFLVNIILALFGHGGITVVGLNTLILSIEGIMASLFFRLFWRVSKRLVLSVFFATFLALSLSTLSMIGVVGLGTSHYEALIHQEKGGGIFDVHLGGEKHEAEGTAPEGEVDFTRFIAIVLPLGFIGWALEGVITALIARYIRRQRPDLLRLKEQTS